MPNRNGTGPQGMGPMTGRGCGPCGQPRRGTGGYGHGHGFGNGQGRGRGRRRGGGGFGGFALLDAAPAGEILETDRTDMSADDQRRALKGERNRLKAMLREVEDTLRTLGAPDRPDPQ